MSSYSDLILAHASLIAYYRLGEGSGLAQDSTANNLDADATSNVTYSVAGAIANDADTALTLNGTTNLVQVPDNNLLDAIDGPVSYECWVKRSATQSAIQTLVGKGSTTLQLRFAADNKITVLKQGTALPGMAASAGTVTDTTTYHHIVATKASGASPLIYLDGVDVTVAGTAQTLSSSTGPLTIGSAGATNRAPVSMDEVAIYGAVLTPAEVLEHYRTGRGIVDVSGAWVPKRRRKARKPKGRPLVLSLHDSVAVECNCAQVLVVGHAPAVRVKSGSVAQELRMLLVAGALDNAEFVVLMDEFERDQQQEGRTS